MLSSSRRMRRADDFRHAIRTGRRRARRTLVVHLAGVPHSERGAAAQSDGPLAGFVVAKSVGGAVVRNQVKRRLRAQVAARLGALDVTDRLVVRALPAAAAATSAQLGADLDGALQALLADRRRAATAPAAG